MAQVYEKIGGLKFAEQPEDAGQMVTRNLARGAARAGEAFLGLPGDIVQGGLGLTNLGIEKVTGKESPLPKELPVATSDWYRQNITKPLTGEYLEPKGKIEKGIDDVIGDFTSLMVPVGPALGAGKALAAAGLGNLASWVTEGIGGSQGQQGAAKMGAMLLATAVNPGSLKKHMKSLYSAAEASIPEDAVVFANPVKKQISETQKKLQYGGSTPIKNEMKYKIGELEGKIDKGRMKVKDVWAFKRDFNELIRNKGGTPELSGIEKDLAPFVNSLDQTLKKYGDVNKKFKYKELKQADDIWQGMNVHSGIKKFLRNTVTPKNIIVGGLFGMSHPHALSKGIPAALATRYGVEAIEPIVRSKAIMKYYAKTAASAALKDKNATIRNFRNLEKVVEQEHPESKSSGMYEKISFNQ